MDKEYKKAPTLPTSDSLRPSQLPLYISSIEGDPSYTHVLSLLSRSLWCSWL